MNFKIVNKNESSDFSVTQVDDAGEISVYEVYFKPEQPCVPKKIRVEFQIPCINACSVWNPQCGLLIFLFFCFLYYPGLFLVLNL